MSDHYQDIKTRHDLLLQQRREEKERIERLTVGKDCAYQDVVNATRDWMISEGFCEPFGSPRKIAEFMKLNQFQEGNTWLVADKFEGQVKRALEALAASDVLIKVKKGERTTWGEYRREPGFWTPAEYGAASQRAAEAAQRKAFFRDRVTRVRQQLEARGLTPKEDHAFAGDPNGQIWISIDEWERVLPHLPIFLPG
jgi:hypothetical protein